MPHLLNINIRNLKMEDLSRMLKAEEESWKEDLRASEETMKERLERYCLGNLGIFDNSRFMGMSVWHPVKSVENSWEENVSRKNFDISSRNVYVINFSAVQDAQGKGYAQMLMHATLLSMKNQGMEFIYIGGRNIPSNRKFYEKFFWRRKSY